MNALDDINISFIGAGKAGVTLGVDIGVRPTQLTEKYLSHRDIGACLLLILCETRQDRATGAEL